MIKHGKLLGNARGVIHGSHQRHRAKAQTLGSHCQGGEQQIGGRVKAPREMMFAKKDALEIKGLDAIPDAEKPIVSGPRCGLFELRIVCRQLEYPRFNHPPLLSSLHFASEGSSTCRICTSSPQHVGPAILLLGRIGGNSSLGTRVYDTVSYPLSSFAAARCCGFSVLINAC